jgi:lysyl-tRNA synthetase, class II
MQQSRLNEIRSVRIAKLDQLKKLGINPYPSKFSRDFISVNEARLKHNHEVSVVGRLMRWREHGNVIFADLKDGTGKIQLLFQKNNHPEKFSVLKLFDVGDFLGVTGKVTTTQAGEITVDVNYFELLSKSLRPLPDDWFGLKDTEERYRKRYLELLLDDKVKSRFVTRSSLVTSVREYLDTLGYLEVETPTLQNQYGGANAKPFKTHLNALDTDMYLRIADELYLKRLMVGGLDKVYEICKDFRNEGFDQTHNPEFTMIEYYETYADYRRVMDVTEGLFKHLAQSVLKSDELKIGEISVNINQPWKRIRMTDLLETSLKLDVKNMDAEQLRDYATSKQIVLLGGETKGQLIFTIFDHLITDQLIQPTWVMDYPRDVSPLSKGKPGEPDWVERFEGYIGGKEICDGWSELTDPAEQRQRFTTDTLVARKDKEEAQKIDEDFIEAMEYGMPPIGGIGIGIDRLTMFFTNTWSIKEVILYPTLRPEISGKVSKQDFEHKLVVIIDSSLPAWQIMNTSGHIAAFLGNKMTEKFDTGKYFVTRDGVNLPRNSQFPVITLSATAGQLKQLMPKVREANLLYIGYVPEMMETTDDNKLAKVLAAKPDSEIVYTGIGLFGLKSEIDKLTVGLNLWGKS